MIAAGTSAVAVSVAVSNALFTSAPTVVLAAEHDQPAQRAAADAAVRLGVPLLLVPATNRDPSAPEVAGEVHRLKATDVLAVGIDAALVRTQLPGLTIHPASPPQAPAAAQHLAPAPSPDTPPVGREAVTVLVRADTGATDDPPGLGAVLAATATASSAGARVLTVHGTDPRADPDTVTALAAHPYGGVLAVGAGFGPAQRLAARITVAATGVQLPGGGQTLFPGRRLVALYGHPGTPALGVLGEQDLPSSIALAKKVAASYAQLSDVPVIPTFEIIATTATAEAGPDGDYSAESSVDSLRPWVEQASAAGMYVVLDLQPGRADFLSQARRYTDLLRLPNVGLALDSEWHLDAGQKPLAQIGGVDAADINAVSAWLARLTATARLPQKLLVLHQFQLSMIGHEQRLNVGHDEIQTLIHMDGNGTPALKDATWAAVTAAAPTGVPFGWKNFYDEDHPMLSPTQTMAHHPTPRMISYQ